MKRILLLTSELGSGHRQAAHAIKQALLERNPAIRIEQIDFWSLMDPGVADAAKNAYLELVTRHPDIYDYLYHLDQHSWQRLLAEGEMPRKVAELAQTLQTSSTTDSVKRKKIDWSRNQMDRFTISFLLASLGGLFQSSVGKFISRGLLKWFPSRLAKRLRRRVLRFAPDVIVATQMHPAAILSRARKRGIRELAPLVAVLTDYGVHDIWIQPGTDCYCVATSEMAQSLRARCAIDQSIHVTGIPLMSGFRRLPSQQQARKEQNLDSVRPTILVTSGGLGLGLHQVAEMLICHESNWQVLVAAGSNVAALESLRPLARKTKERLRLFGWTDRMEVLMRASDVIVGKPGGLTTAEALACGRPLVATHSLGGQEGFNVRFLERHRVGCLAPADRLATTLQSLLADPDELGRTHDRAWRLGRRYGAERIVNQVYELACVKSKSRKLYKSLKVQSF